MADISKLSPDDGSTILNIKDSNAVHWNNASINKYIGINQLKVQAVSTSSGGVIYTVNPNKSITFSGTPTGYSFLHVGEFNVDDYRRKYRLTGLSNTTNIVWGYYTYYDSSGTVLANGDLTSTNEDIVLDLSNYPNISRVAFQIKRQVNNIATSGTAYLMVIDNDMSYSENYIQYLDSNEDLSKLLNSIKPLILDYDNAIKLNSGDLNDYLYSCVLCWQISAATSINNLPNGFSGAAIVQNIRSWNGPEIRQILYPRDKINYYMRIYSGSEWSDWFLFQGTQIT